MNEIKAQLNKLSIAPRKVRAIIRIISKMPVGEAEAQLLFRKERSAKPILKLLRSAVANAKNKGIPTENLYIKTIFANEGPVIKRWLPRARGMATPLHKKFSHVTMLLAEGTKKSRFAMTDSIVREISPRNRKSDKKTKAVKSANKRSDKIKDKNIVKEKKDIKTDKASGATTVGNPIKKLFRRKSV